MKLIDLFEKTKKDDFNVDAYHGTNKAFKKFDPNFTGDIGIHFGSVGVATDVAKGYFQKMGEYQPGANIIPVKLRLKNPLRVRDMFSTLKTTYMNRAKQWVLNTHGFRPNQEEHDEIFDASKSADKIRYKACREWGALDSRKDKEQALLKQADKRFWTAIQTSVERQGYDGLVYSNKIEGKGEDSYVVFNPKNVKFKFS